MNTIVLLPYKTYQIPISLTPKLIPPFVVEWLNQLIRKNWNGHSSIVRASEFIDKINKHTGMSKEEIIDNHWTDIEVIYISTGWRVGHDKPKFKGDYEEYFTFTKL